MEAKLETIKLLRVLATIAVVFGHSASFFKAFSSTQWPNFPYIQSMAVTVFFAVSGFTIAWLLDVRRNNSFWRFAYDRYMRLAIPLLPILLIFWVAEAALYGNQHQYPGSLSPLSFLGNIAFLQNMAGLEIPPFGTNRPLWTISLEFWIYIAFGGVVIGTRARSKAILAIAALAIILLIPYVFYARGRGLPIVWLLGAGLYYGLRNRDGIPKKALFALLPGALLFVTLIATPKLWPSGGEYSPKFHLVLFGFFATLITAGMIWRIPSRLMAVVDGLGECAYTVYLSHYPLMYMLDWTGWLGKGEIASLLATMICLLAGWMLSFPFERQYKSIREKIAQWIRVLPHRKLPPRRLTNKQ